jgi:outer membrane autotransporter protein
MQIFPGESGVRVVILVMLFGASISSAALSQVAIPVPFYSELVPAPAGGSIFEPFFMDQHPAVAETFAFNGRIVATGIPYAVDVMPSASDLIRLTGPGGQADVSGGVLRIVAAPGIYAPNSRYTIVTASQGVTGKFASVTEDLAFLTPTLSYDANDVYLSLVLGPNAFASMGQTVNQQAIGHGLDAIAASGNLAGVVATLAGISTEQGAPALQALSGEPYADFGTVNARASQLFMNAVGRQMAVERAAAVGTAKGVALTAACDVACDDIAPPRFSGWLSGIGSTGSVVGDNNAAGLTYTLGGTAFGIDYRLDPSFLFGIAGGYIGGTQWVNGFAGNGYTDALSVALYASLTQGGFYADALAGYANANNRLQRIVSIPGAQTGIANGNTNANQFLGQVEAGYKIGLPLPPKTSISSFGRLQIGSINQAGFTESGTSLFNFSVAQQTTTSVRTTFGADFGANFDLGGGRPLDIGLRLGWTHEFADTARPISAAFAAAPVQQFTVYGATPQRDSAVVGFSAAAAVTDRASVFTSYDGEVGGGTNNHALRVGFRMTW